MFNNQCSSLPPPNPHASTPLYVCPPGNIYWFIMINLLSQPNSSQLHIVIGQSTIKQGTPFTIMSTFTLFLYRQFNIYNFFFKWLRPKTWLASTSIGNHKYLFVINSSNKCLMTVTKRRQSPIRNLQKSYLWLLIFFLNSK